MVIDVKRLFFFEYDDNIRTVKPNAYLKIKTQIKSILISCYHYTYIYERRQHTFTLKHVH